MRTAKERFEAKKAKLDEKAKANSKKIDPKDRWRQEIVHLSRQIKITEAEISARNTRIDNWNEEIVNLKKKIDQPVADQPAVEAEATT